MMNTLTHDRVEQFEAALIPLWAELLGHASSDVNADTDFFKAGGHSLSAMLLATRMKRDLNKSVPLFALVENPTPAALARYVSRMEAHKVAEEPKAPDGSVSQTDRLLGYNDMERRVRRNAWFEKYYATAIGSAAHAEFCRRIYGDNFGQHGMADYAQIDQLLDRMNAKQGDRILDLGCGYGLISEYIARKTGAHVVGVDLAPSAIKFANELARKRDKLQFEVMDIDRLDFPPCTFSHIVSIDTIYYASSTRALIEKFSDIGRPNLKLGILRTFPIRSFTRETWSPHRTELAVLLSDLFGGYDTVDLSREENAHWRKKVEVLRSLKPDFIAEGNQELHEFRYKEAEYESGIEQFRYMFFAERNA